MTVTDIGAPLVSEGTGADRAALVTGLSDLAIFMATHETAPLPGIDGHVHLSIPVPGRTRGERVEALAVIAERLGVPVVKRLGSLRAERRFGPVTLTAAINDADYISTLLRRRDERDAQAAGRVA